MSLCDVVLSGSVDVAIGPLADALSAARKIPYQDAAVQIRHGWGVLASGISRAEAEAVAQAMGQKGIDCRVLDQAAMPALPAPQEAIGVNLNSDSMTFKFPTAYTDVPYKDIKILASAPLSLMISKSETVIEGKTKTQKALQVGLFMAGIPLSVGPKEKAVVKTTTTSDLSFWLDVITDEARFLINAERIDYSFFGKKMAPNALQNFKMMLAELCAHAPQAVKNKGTRWFVENKVLSQAGYESLDDLNKECRLLLAVSQANNRPS